MFILLADDHAVVRRGLQQILLEAYPHAQFAEATTGDEVLREIPNRNWSVLVLDVNMPGRSGVDILREVRKLRPRLPVIMLSVQPEDQYALRCLRAGASGYLNKDAATEQLVDAIRKVLSGGRYVSPQMAEKAIFDFSSPLTKAKHEELSDRELEVVKMIAKGIALTAIAQELHVSVKTVSTYRSRVLLKMKMQSNAELTRYSLEHKLID